MLDVDSLTVKQLLDFRKRESSESGHALRDLRHRYLERLEKQVAEVKTAQRASDVEEMERRFKQESADDLKHLKDELRAEKKQLIFSKDVITTFVAVAAPVVSSMFPVAAPLTGVLTAAGVPATIGGVISANSKWSKARADILKKHPMAYLYELQN